MWAARRRLLPVLAAALALDVARAHRGFDGGLGDVMAVDGVGRLLGRRGRPARAQQAGALGANASDPYNLSFTIKTPSGHEAMLNLSVEVTSGSGQKLEAVAAPGKESGATVAVPGGGDKADGSRDAGPVATEPEVLVNGSREPFDVLPVDGPRDAGPVATEPEVLGNGSRKPVDATPARGDQEKPPPAPLVEGEDDDLAKLAEEVDAVQPTLEAMLRPIESEAAKLEAEAAKENASEETTATSTTEENTTEEATAETASEERELEDEANRLEAQAAHDRAMNQTKAANPAEDAEEDDQQKKKKKKISEKQARFNAAVDSHQLEMRPLKVAVKTLAPDFGVKQTKERALEYWYLVPWLVEKCDDIDNDQELVFREPDAWDAVELKKEEKEKIVAAFIHK